MRINKMKIKKLKLYECISVGGEGAIYKVGKNNVAKIFRFPEPKFSTDKIEQLSRLELGGFIMPKSIVTMYNKKVGYSMEYKELPTLAEVFETATIDKKIDLLIKLERLIKQAHLNQLYICDFNLENFLYDGENIYAIDCDNFTYKNMQSELITSYTDFHLKNIKNEISSDSDKVGFTILLLETFINPEMYRILWKGNQQVINYLRELNLNSDFSNLLINNLQKDTEKIYFEENIGKAKL